VSATTTDGYEQMEFRCGTCGEIFVARCFVGASDEELCDVFNAAHVCDFGGPND
jgi:hypothetical protein